MKEGYLQKREDGRFQLQDADGNYITYFTSGNYIEIFDEDEEKWLIGAIEYNHGWDNYAFYNDYYGYLRIYNGDKARCK